MTISFLQQDLSRLVQSMDSWSLDSRLSVNNTQIHISL
jgi:hypothetical protein